MTPSRTHSPGLPSTLVQATTVSLVRVSTVRGGLLSLTGVSFQTWSNSHMLRILQAPLIMKILLCSQNGEVLVVFSMEGDPVLTASLSKVGFTVMRSIQRQARIQALLILTVSLLHMQVWSRSLTAVPPQPGYTVYLHHLP